MEEIIASTRPEQALDTTYLTIAFLAIAMSVFMAILSIAYFFIVRSKFRWIKLLYAINSLVVAYFIYSTILAQDPHEMIFAGGHALDVLLSSIIILQVTLIGGLIVSYSKLRNAGVSVKAEVKHLLGSR